MSFSSFNNSLPQGYQLQQCSPASPIGGKDGNDIFRMLRLTPNGSISSLVPVYPPLVNYIGENPNSQTQAAVPGLRPVSRLLIYSQVVIVGNPGVYRVKPAAICEKTPGGAVTMILTSNGSTLSTYAAGLTPGTSDFLPGITELASGTLAVWDNVAFANLPGATGAVTIDNTFVAEEVYLGPNIYNLIVVVHTAITTSSNTFLTGFTEFTFLG
jgi:hypothetical protein